jgi:ABC-type uncharacterized transport system ATPase subunit
VTLLTAVARPDAGETYIEGKLVPIGSPRIAPRLGIDMTHRDFSLSPNLSILNNVFFGRELTVSSVGASP